MVQSFNKMVVEKVLLLILVQDENFLEVVRDVFIRFYEEGIIYCVNCFVNWDFMLMIVFSNFEVDNKEFVG